MSSETLMLEDITREEDPRVITVRLSLLGESFSDHYLDTAGVLGVSPRSPLSFTREELSLHAAVARWAAGQSLALPMPIHAPAPESLSPRDQRRGLYLDTPLVRRQLARLRAA